MAVAFKRYNAELWWNGDKTAVIAKKPPFSSIFLAKTDNLEAWDKLFLFLISSFDTWFFNIQTFLTYSKKCLLQSEILF